MASSVVLGLVVLRASVLSRSHMLIWADVKRPIYLGLAEMGMDTLDKEFDNVRQALQGFLPREPQCERILIATPYQTSIPRDQQGLQLAGSPLRDRFRLGLPASCRCSPGAVGSIEAARLRRRPLA